MAHFKWNDNYNIGFKLIDDQHKILISIINDLYDAQRHGLLQSTISETLDKLSDYTVYHFSYEKELFAQHAYPKAAEHLEEHDYFVDKVKDLQLELSKGSIVLSLKTMDFLKDWTITHILGSDKEFGEFVKQRELGLE
ncbi:MAG: bacteriohemerythrin [Candidatus Latescibacterota bacterium]|jgi:hemerythrin-like metal-binding protein|nr:bacteriohemerythrin [Ignavibacteriaceae bacterium]